VSAISIQPPLSNVFVFAMVEADISERPTASIAVKQGLPDLAAAQYQTKGCDHGR